jgi:hypothetical protein
MYLKDAVMDLHERSLMELEWSKIEQCTDNDQFEVLHAKRSSMVFLILVFSF